MDRPTTSGEDPQLRQRLREIDQDLMSRAPENVIDPSLDRMRMVMDLLGDPQSTFPVIHVTGTNGKTSTARLMDAILTEFGLTTGRFTSPHLHDVRERICLADEPLTAEQFVAAYDDVAPYVAMVDAQSLTQGGPRMTFFEVLTTMAYAMFADAPVHVAIVEVGLGGAWDATNVADGQVAVITPIGLDHQEYLGDTIEAIAAEKAGIIKEGATAVVAEQDLDALAVLQERAAGVDARLLLQGAAFAVTSRTVAVGGQVVDITTPAGRYEDLFVPLHGVHQSENAAVALTAVEAFLAGGDQALDIDTVRAGLARATSPGRLELVRSSPTIFVDAAHNPHGARALAAAIRESFVFTTLVGVVGVLRGKDADGILEALEPVLDQVVVTRTSSPRAMAVADLADVARAIFGDHRVTEAASLPDAIDVAATLAEADGLGGAVLATGSVVTAAEVRALLSGRD